MRNPTVAALIAVPYRPSLLARLTVEQYEALVDSGVFTERDRFTRIKGHQPHVCENLR